MPNRVVHHPPDDDLCQYTDFSILPVDLDFFVLDDKLATEDCKALRFVYLRQCPDINLNPGPPGRLSFKLEINFKDPLKYLEDIKSFCILDRMEMFCNTSIKNANLRTAQRITACISHLVIDDWGKSKVNSYPTRGRHPPSAHKQMQIIFLGEWGKCQPLTHTNKHT